MRPREFKQPATLRLRNCLVLIILGLPVNLSADQLKIGGTIFIDPQPGNPNYFVFGSLENPYLTDNVKFYGSATRVDSDFVSSLLIQLVIVKNTQAETAAKGSIDFSLGGYARRPGKLSTAYLKMSGHIAGATFPVSISSTGHLIGPPIDLGPLSANWKDDMPFDKSTGKPMPLDMNPPFTFVQEIGWSFNKGNPIGAAIVLNYGSELGIVPTNEPSTFILLGLGLVVLAALGRRRTRRIQRPEKPPHTL